MAEPIGPTEPVNNEQTPKPPASPTPPVSGPLAALEAKFYEWFVYKAPFQLPSSVTDFIVKFGPWITLVIGILFIPVFLAAIAALSVIGTVATSVYGAYIPQPNVLYWLGIIVLIVQIVLMFVSIPKLLRHERKGWQLVFYANLISVVYSLLTSLGYGFFNFGSFLVAVIGAVIGLYVLFQIRRYYVK